jgi:pyruvate,orthophosphate dikinase
MSRTRPARTAAHSTLQIGAEVTAAAASPECFGAKACGLWRMARIGLPVPPAFVLGTDWCRDFLSRGREPDGLPETLHRLLRGLEAAAGRRYGDGRRPLLLAVRSGAADSMPGMMETILNVGLNDTTVQGLIRHTGNPRLAWDCYRRLLQTYAEVVHGCRAEPFERVYGRLAAPGRAVDSHALRAITQEYLGMMQALTGAVFPQDPDEQLRRAVAAVFGSWESPRASEYRTRHGIDARAGTAATVQAMVFGNAGGTSGSGVGFTRNPATGANELYMDFLANAQGEDVVAGTRNISQQDALAALLPAARAEIERVRQRLETEFRDMQDFEFTIEDGRVYLLQTRAGKRTPLAALRIAVDLVNEGLIDAQEALARLAGIDLAAVDEQVLDVAGDQHVLASATAASSGIASGVIALDADALKAAHARGQSGILVRDQTSTEDVAALALAEGLLTARGGRTSHAAVVARQMNKACIVGCVDLRIDQAARRIAFGEQVLNEGEVITLDGGSGLIYPGALGLKRIRPEACLAAVAGWKKQGTGATATGAARARRKRPRQSMPRTRRRDTDR